jgi:L-lysine exporter family protein LysE/ArgO
MTAAASLPLLQGGPMMAGLIVAIGAQNACVLRQGLLRAHVGAVVALCALSDWVLTALGVFGLGGLVATSPLATQLLRWFGAAFLAWYAIRAAQRAWHGSQALAAQGSSGGLQGTLATADAVAQSSRLPGHRGPARCRGRGPRPGRQAGFRARRGARLAATWFSTLGYGAAALSRWLARPAVWRDIDALIAVVMAATAINLLRGS